MNPIESTRVTIVDEERPETTVSDAARSESPREDDHEFLVNLADLLDNTHLSDIGDRLRRVASVVPRGRFS